MFGIRYMLEVFENTVAVGPVSGSLPSNVGKIQFSISKLRVNVEQIEVTRHLVIIEGDHLAGKSSIAECIRRQVRALSVFEDRGSVSHKGIQACKASSHYFSALRALIDQSTSKFCLVRGPVSHFASGTISHDDLIRLSDTVFGDLNPVWIYLPLTVSQYKIYCECHGICLSTYEAKEFVKRSKFFTQAAGLLGDRLHVMQQHAEYQETIKDLLFRKGWVS